jgi:hypothetical protein
MAKTHAFTRNQDDSEVVVVIDKIKTVDHDAFSECTRIIFIDGTHEGVKESVEEVRKVIDDA